MNPIEYALADAIAKRFPTLDVPSDFTLSVLTYANAMRQVYNDIDWILSNDYSFSLYMFHGGTNFGFENGALWNTAGYLEPVTTSYDYGAPLDESGRPTQLYTGLRKIIGKYLQPGEELPAAPKNVSLMSLPDVQLRPVMSLFDSAVLGLQLWLRLTLAALFLFVCCLKSFRIGTRRSFLVSPYENEALVSFVG